MPKKSILVSAFALLAFFAVYVFSMALAYPNLFTQGDFQDVFAGIAALFSGLAFLGVVYAILLQREELRLQRQELELTRKELARTAKAQEKSEEALSKQAASLKATAKLNGLSAQLNHINSLLEVTGIGKYPVDPVLKSQANSIIAEITDIIREK